ncbi:MAG: hypothetical protein AAF805_08620, partial [Planctomycetota bacterium]
TRLMDEVKKKVLLDLFVSPWTLPPIVGGLTAWMLSWAVGGDPTMNLVGLAGVLVGVGVQASRIVWGIEGLTEKAHDYVEGKQKAARAAELDRLEEKLSQDEDPRSEESLRRLRALRRLFHEDPPKTAGAIAIRDQVQRLFEASVRQLERSYDLWEKARRLPAGTGRPLLDQRRRAVDEVVRTVNHLAKTVERYHEMQQGADEADDLARLREELDATIEVARRADERIEELGVATRHDEEEFLAAGGDSG